MLVNMNPIILIVDDNIDILANLQLMLEINDYKVYSAKNGKQAIEVLKKLDQLPNLIISDIIMPEMNGYEFFNTISKNPQWSNIPFIFLTVCSSLEDQLIDKISDEDIIVKPYNDDELLQIISKKLV
ncbi:hypothetical protein LCGC14_1515940 [marine sediment metagenome]|uniref:Response regulatory domain-containing protein n=1 Tax=marine sediment metagenome TaxID=412755 RepID=A0A0F9JKU0_9ZZZZ